MQATQGPLEFKERRGGGDKNSTDSIAVILNGFSQSLV